METQIELYHTTEIIPGISINDPNNLHNLLSMLLYLFSFSGRRVIRRKIAPNTTILPAIITIICVVFTTFPWNLGLQSNVSLIAVISFFGSFSLSISSNMPRSIWFLRRDVPLVPGRHKCQPIYHKWIQHCCKEISKIYRWTAYRGNIEICLAAESTTYIKILYIRFCFIIYLSICLYEHY